MSPFQVQQTPDKLLHIKELRTRLYVPPCKRYAKKQKKEERKKKEKILKPENR